MKLYYAPLACSLATRVTLAEIGREATFVEVDPRTKKTADGSDFLDVNPLGLVPAVLTDDGDMITENIAVLLHVADGSALAKTEDRARLLQWLSFISSELHKGTFSFFFDPAAGEETRAYAIDKSGPRLAYLDSYLSGREYLLGAFSVADAYLLTVLHWAQATPIDLTPWPAIMAYVKRGHGRPSFQAARALELPLYLAERKRAANG